MPEKTVRRWAQEAKRAALWKCCQEVFARRHSFAAVDHIRRQPATSSSRPGAPPGADREWKSRQNQKL